MSKPDITPVPLRILALEIKDVKRISYVEVAPKSRVVGIYGKNGAGKTTLLDAIMWALGGARTIQMQPIRKGEDRGHVRLAIGDQSIEFIVTRLLKEGRKPELVIESPSGAEYPKPQEFLNGLGLLGAISLDPHAFIRMDPKDRVNLLKRLVQLEVNVEELDRQNEGDYRKRTDVNRDIERLKGQVSLYAGGVKMDMDVTPIDTDALVAEMSKASEVNAAIHREHQRRLTSAQYLDTHKKDLIALDDDIARLVAKREALVREIEELQKEQQALPQLDTMVDVSELGERIKKAQAENSMRQLQRTARERFETAKKELAAEVKKAEAFTAAMEERTARKTAALAAAKYPVPGLSFTEDGVFFDGVPFEQASMAQQIRVSLGIAIATRPKLPVVLIRDGALLDDDSMAIVEEMANEYGAQVWIERQKVSSDGERGDVIVLQEGEVAEVK